MPLPTASLAVAGVLAMQFAHAGADCEPLAGTIRMLRDPHRCVTEPNSHLSMWIERFTNETGIAVIEHTADETLMSYEEQVLVDIGEFGNDGTGVYDIFAFIEDSMLPSAAEGGGVLDLTPYIRSSSSYRTSDIFAGLRRYGLSYSSGTQLVPFDADFVSTFVLGDLLEQPGFKLPATYDELLEMATRYHGTDINGDGTPDYGMCVDPVFPGRAERHLQATVAPYLQALGPSDGFFFSPEDFEPLIATEAFRHGMRVHKALLNLTCPNDPYGTCLEQHRCAFGINFSVKNFYGSNGYRVFRNPGAASVLDRTSPTGALVPCTPERCPHAECDENGKCVNHAPLVAAAYNLMLSSRVSEEQRRLAFRFAEFMQKHSTEVMLAARCFDVWRMSSIASDTEPQWRAAGFTDAGIDDTRHVGFWAMSHDNVALLPRVPGEFYDLIKVSLANYFVYDYNLENVTTRLVNDLREMQAAQDARFGELYTLNQYRLSLLLPARALPGNGTTTYIVQKDDSLRIVVIVLTTVAGLVFVLVIAVSTARFYFRYKAAVAAQRMQEEQKVERIRRAASTVTTCGFSVCLMKYEAFLKHGALASYEEVLHAGDLIVLHLYHEVLAFASVYPTLFFSHQWLAFDEPDPNGVHYAEMVKAATAIIRTFCLEPSDLYIWVDYSSIPQRNPIMKKLSVNSLAVYASVSRYFVIVCPDTAHKNTKDPCNEATYRLRGWCRLEQWARLSVGGLHNMFQWDAGLLKPLVGKPTWFKESIQVFSGEFTDENDKKTLVDTVLGLYAHALQYGDEDSDLIRTIVQQHKTDVFPREYFGDLVEVLEGQLQSLSRGEHAAMLVTADKLPDELSRMEKADRPVTYGQRLKDIFKQQDDIPGLLDASRSQNSLYKSKKGAASNRSVS